MDLPGDRPVLTIDLEAVRRNHLALRRRAAGAECAAVVKADAYGLGVDRIAPVLHRAGCRTFFVATLEEAVELRSLIGPVPRILILNGIAASGSGDCLRHRLVPVLNHLGQLEDWNSLARRQDRPLPAVIHLDTGMSRLGLPEDEIRTLRDSPHLMDALCPDLIMSHLVSAGDPDRSRAQKAVFDSLRSAWPRTPASLANSRGILLGDDYHHQLVRPGIALYGIRPFDQVVRLEAPVLQVRTIRPPASVGYDATWSAPGPARIATIPIGYADGYLRSAGNRSQVRIDGQAARVVGRISMDLATLDVTRIPGAGPGTRVTLLGGAVPLESLAEAAGTIPYEILTSLGARHLRRYLTADAAASGTPPGCSP